MSSTGTHTFEKEGREGGGGVCTCMQAVLYMYIAVTDVLNPCVYV